MTGLFVGVLAAFLPIDVLLMLVNMGTLFAFVIVCAAVLIMRRTHPEAERPFRVPFVPFVPILGIASCLLLMFSLPSENWWRLIVWLAIGLIHLLLLWPRPQHAAPADYSVNIAIARSIAWAQTPQ